jgi:hypothetical protein
MANPNPRIDQLETYQFKKGQPSANPTGRPKKRPVSEEAAKLMGEEAPPEIVRKYVRIGARQGDTWARIMVLARAVEALRHGGTFAHKELRESIEGKASQRIELQSREDNQIKIVVVFDEPRFPIPDEPQRQLPAAHSERHGEAIDAVAGESCDEGRAK